MITLWEDVPQDKRIHPSLLFNSPWNTKNLLERLAFPGNYCPVAVDASNWGAPGYLAPCSARRSSFNNGLCDRHAKRGVFSPDYVRPLPTPRYWLDSDSAENRLIDTLRALVQSLAK